MGMESFFVSVLSNKMSISYNGTRTVEGDDGRYNIEWREVMQKKFDLEIMEDYKLVNGLIEFYCKKTKQGGVYISLVGCLSCFEEASYEMSKIIEEISNLVMDTPNVFVFGNVFPYERNNFIKTLESDYVQKKKAFDKMYPKSLSVSPSKFYESYKRNNCIFLKIKRAIKNMLY